MVEINIFIAFAAGLVSFLSPCVFPLIPAFLSYLAGTSINEIREKDPSARIKIFINTLLFVLGFSAVFAFVGAILNTILVNISYDLKIWMGRIGGTIIIAFGLYLAGLLKLPFLDREYKLKVKKFKYSYLTSFVFGAAFAIGWTPCVGAVLGGILTLAAVSPGSAFSLLLFYSFGLGLPFLIAGMFTSQMTGIIAKAGRWLKYFNIIVGILLIILGILVFTNTLSRIAAIPFLNSILVG